MYSEVCEICSSCVVVMWLLFVVCRVWWIVLCFRVLISLGSGVMVWVVVMVGVVGCGVGIGEVVIVVIVGIVVLFLKFVVVSCMLLFIRLICFSVLCSLWMLLG